MNLFGQFFESFWEIVDLEIFFEFLIEISKYIPNEIFQYAPFIFGIPFIIYGFTKKKDSFIVAGAVALAVGLFLFLSYFWLCVVYGETPFVCLYSFWL